MTLHSNRSLTAAWPQPDRSLTAAWPQPDRNLPAAWPQPDRSGLYNNNGDVMQAAVIQTAADCLSH